jgi:hypothetical protein
VTLPNRMSECRPIPPRTGRTRDFSARTVPTRERPDKIHRTCGLAPVSVNSGSVAAAWPRSRRRDRDGPRRGTLLALPRDAGPRHITGQRTPHPVSLPNGHDATCTGVGRFGPGYTAVLGADTSATGTPNPDAANLAICGMGNLAARGNWPRLK